MKNKTTTKFAISGSSVHVFKLNEDTVINKLPAQIYSVKFHPLEGFSLSIDNDKLKIPTKLYGDLNKRTNKCITTYKDRDTSTGILLTGDKGTGKTLQMALLANKVIEELKLPVILIKEAYAGSQFISFLENIGECCLIFDEFGKMYSSTTKTEETEIPQKSLLSLMDGVDKTKRMIIMTENEEYDINSFMLNRPSRIYYHFKFKKLPESSTTDFCKDKNVPEKITKEIIEFSRKAEIFSFDMLQSVIEEHTRFNCDLEEILKDLNIDTTETNVPQLQILKILDLKTETEQQLMGNTIIPDPAYQNSCAQIPHPNPPTKHEAHQTLEIFLDDSQLAYEINGQRIYETGDYTIVTKLLPPKLNNYQRFL